jgi:hypothetical protein
MAFWKPSIPSVQPSAHTEFQNDTNERLGHMSEEGGYSLHHASHEHDKHCELCDAQPEERYLTIENFNTVIAFIPTPPEITTHQRAGYLRLA